MKPASASKARCTYQWALRGSPPSGRSRQSSTTRPTSLARSVRRVLSAPPSSTPWVNSEAMSVHQVCDGSHAVLVCDGAGWHQTGQRFDRAQERHPASPAALRTRTQSDRERLGISPRQQAQQTSLAMYDDIVEALLRRVELAHRRHCPRLFDHDTQMGIGHHLGPLV